MKTNLLIGFFLLVLSYCSFATSTLVNADTLIAEFTATATSGCAGLEIKFFNESVGDYTEISWSFEGGIPASSTEETPTVHFPDSGTFVASLTVNSLTEVAYDSVYINMSNPEPQVSYSFENTGLSVDFNNQSTGSTNYLWDFGDGEFSSEYSPQHTYPEEGVYIVQLRSTNDCKSVIRSEIVILDFDLTPITYTANDVPHPYEGPFRPGVNLGYFPPWTDGTLADIAAGNPKKGVRGAGAKTIRPALFEYFLEEFDYDIRVSTFKHYDSLGLKDNTVIIGFPSEAHRDPNYYCPEEQSELFANMYEDIWDNGENGTPVNDNNYYALYLWKMVNLYKDEVGFWEIWNEPGFDYTFVTGYLPPGTPNNWWDNNPQPCDYKLRAPIFHYIRLLRISYEVIKTVDPEGYVTLASVGFSAFLDAILRNTDNPIDGSTNTDYPLGGGAYFDAIGIHSYPHFDGTLRYWDDNIQDFVYSRHTDKAITSISNAKDTFEIILENYGYDDQQYPKKEWIITEINLPRKSFSAESYGSDEVQINFVMKAYIESVRNDIRQMQVYDMSDSHTPETAVGEFQLMGLYKVLFGVFPYGQQINNLGIAYRSISELVFGAEYDIDRTNELNLPDHLDGAAFLDRNGHHHYVLWAKTQVDLSEDVQGNYSFPAEMNISTLQKRTWEYSETGELEILGAQNILLTGEPIFLSDTINTVLVAPTVDFKVEVLDYCTPASVQYSDHSSTNVANWEWTFPDGTPETSTEKNPTVVYDQAGFYSASLKVSNALGSDSIYKTEIFEISNLQPEAAFSNEIFDKMVSFTNTSLNATSYIWDLGDNNIVTEVNPDHNYPVPGIYQVELKAINGCDTAYAYETVIINPEQINPIPNFYTDVRGGCPGASVQFFNSSSVNADDFFWLFLGGTPSNSTEENPVVTYSTPGYHAVSLQVANAAGSLAIFRDSFIFIEEAPSADFQLEQTLATISLTNMSSGANGYLWDFGDGNTSSEVHPNHTYTQGGIFDIELKAFNSCDTISSFQQVDIEAIPRPAFSADTQEACPPFQIQFTDNTIGNADQRHWTFPGGEPENSTETNPLVTYNSVGSWPVTLRVSNATGSDTLEQLDFIVGLPSPIADFSFTGNSATYDFTNSSSDIDADSIRWDFGDGNGSEEFEPIHTYGGSGSYEVQLIVANSCGADTFSQTIDVLIDGLYDPTFPATVQLFPNPNTGHFALVLQGEATKLVALKIFNVLGQQMHAEEIDFGRGLFSKNYRFDDWASGTYWLALSSGEAVYWGKFLVEK